jgi:hypothetical protein
MSLSKYVPTVRRSVLDIYANNPNRTGILYLRLNDNEIIFRN